MTDRCPYCHGENGEHACNCWAPDEYLAKERGAMHECQVGERDNGIVGATRRVRGILAPGKSSTASHKTGAADAIVPPHV
jgi:hypothetical protein